MVGNALSGSFQAAASLMPDVKRDRARNINLQNTRAHSATAPEGIRKLAQSWESAPTIRSWRSRSRGVNAGRQCVRRSQQKVATSNCGSCCKVTNPRKLTYAEKCPSKSAFFGRGGQMNADPEQQRTDVEDGRFAKWSLAHSPSFHLQILVNFRLYIHH